MSKNFNLMLNLKKIVDSIPEPRELSGKTTFIFPKSKKPMSKWFRLQYRQANCAFSISMVCLLNAVVTDGRSVFFGYNITLMKEIIKNDPNLNPEQKSVELPIDILDDFMFKLCSVMREHEIISYVDGTEDVYHVVHPFIRSFLPECFKEESYETALIEEFRRIYTFK